MTTLRIIVLHLMVCAAGSVLAQELQFGKPHGFYSKPFALTIANGDGQRPLPADATIYYTLDGSEPTTASQPYRAPITVSGTTIVRAAAIAPSGPATLTATATYLFVDDILKQGNRPAGYPTTWGSYTDNNGTATADYEMDPEMTGDATLRPKIAEGLQSLPVVSIVTDKDNLFSHEADPDRGGIYIFTGPPVGDGTGHGWTRPASVELIEPAAQADDASQHEGFSTTCGLRLHGGHGRLAEKNPKHSFRLVFKEEYGPKSLKYPVYGDDQPQKFDQLILRCHFGNAWQHWAEDNRQKAQYTRDVWSRRMQLKMGRTGSNARYVNVFLNGMYWGLYNLSERVDDQFGKNYMGGSKSDYDVVKIEEDGGNHTEASEGTLDAWTEMLQVASHAGDDAYYERLDTLLDIPAFIDYMIINQYDGNNDWDYHNWYAIRRRGKDSEGFRFICWDSEIIFVDPYFSNVAKNSGYGFPTGIFHNLLQNERFARQYVRRAKELLADDGMLGQQSVVQLWDSLFNVVHAALYAEAARWGDYRRDVHRYTSQGQLYTVDNQYMNERRRLLEEYFPMRSATALDQIVSYVGVDDFEAPDTWQPLLATMFREWDGSGADAQPLDVPVGVDWRLGSYAGSGEAVAGFVGVEHNHYADLSQYDRLILRGEGGTLRLLANRLVAHGPWKQVNVWFSPDCPYWDSELGVIVVPLDEFRTALTNEGNWREDDFVHLNAIKVDWNNSVKLAGAWLVPKETPFIVGDADGNGMVNVSDVTATINHILGHTPDTFSVQAADADDNGIVNVSDVTAIINIILGK